jgi:hypothetical protein
MAKKNDVVIKAVENKDLEEKIAEFKELQIVMDSVKKRMEEIKGEVKGYMTDINETYISVGQYKCKISEVVTTKFDKDYMKKHAPKTFEAAQYTDTTTRFTIN